MSGCVHHVCEPVELAITGEVVGQVCVSCLEAVPVEWGCGDCSFTYIGTMADPHFRLVLDEQCPRHGGGGRQPRQHISPSLYL